MQFGRSGEDIFFFQRHPGGSQIFLRAGAGGFPCVVIRDQPDGLSGEDFLQKFRQVYEGVVRQQKPFGIQPFGDGDFRHTHKIHSFSKMFVNFGVNIAHAPLFSRDKYKKNGTDHWIGPVPGSVL